MGDISILSLCPCDTVHTLLSTSCFTYKVDHSIGFVLVTKYHINNKQEMVSNSRPLIR